MKTILLLFVFLYPISGIAFENESISQYITKQYTEIFGRMPDQQGWNFYEAEYNSHGSCDIISMSYLGITFFNSKIFLNKSYTNKQKILILYRSIFLREPDTDGFKWALDSLESGMPFNDIVSLAYSSNEFKYVTRLLCKNKLKGWRSKNLNPIDISDKYLLEFYPENEIELRKALNKAIFSDSKTVILNPSTVIELTSQLIIPPGVKLETFRVPKPTEYAKMARLIRASNFAKPLISLRNYSKIESIWIDGRRSRFSENIFNGNPRINLDSHGSIDIRNSKFSDSIGWTNINHPNPCEDSKILNNLITSYSSSHYIGGWTDGISFSCNNTIVAYNEIIDATDVGIVMFASILYHPDGTQTDYKSQKSIISGNKIFNSGNSAYGMINLDPVKNNNSTYLFDSAIIEDNLLWTSNNVHVDLAIGVGTRSWFGDLAGLGIGGLVENNTSGFYSISTLSGIVISGMLDTTIIDNTLSLKDSDHSTCPKGQILIENNIFKASIDTTNTIYPLIYTNDVINCIGH